MADCTYRVPDLEASGDALYGPRTCLQPFLNWAWPVHGFNYDWWQGGWGYNDVCNISKPLSRCLNAMWLLNYSAPDYQNQAWNTDPLHWGGRYVREQFKYYNDLRADCGDGPVARTTGCQQARQWKEWRCTAGYNERRRTCDGWHPLFSWLCILFNYFLHWVCTFSGWVAMSACNVWYGTVGGGQNVTLFLKFFYPADGGNRDVIARAGTLIHEARHIGNKPHNAQFPSGSTYGGGSDGADSHWEYGGAWTYEASYLWWFHAQGTRTSIAMRQSAKQEANVILSDAFATPTGLVVP